jgi:hypothetical protein
MRKIRDPFRIVFFGSIYGLTKMNVEYVVVDGDLMEEPEVVEQDEEYFNSEIGDVWQQMIDEAKRREELE